ncbi:hypothetical protein ACWDO7_22855 [Streptomyces sp. NPDC003656]
MAAWERFNNRILSITPAEPGWEVDVQHVILLNRHKEVEDIGTFPVAVWAVVEVIYRDGTPVTRVDPVFLDAGSLTTATEYRRLHSNADPEPGEPKEMVSIRLRRNGA